jgi:Integrase core domain
MRLHSFESGKSNLRVLEVLEIKTVPYVPLSHPFVERLIGTIRREYLDQMLFWTVADLEAKLLGFQHYYNAHRTTPAWMGAYRNRVLKSLVPVQLSVRIDGSGIAEDCRRQQPHDCEFAMDRLIWRGESHF